MDACIANIKPFKVVEFSRMAMPFWRPAGQIESKSIDPLLINTLHNRNAMSLGTANFVSTLKSNIILATLSLLISPARGRYVLNVAAGKLFAPAIRTAGKHR